MANSLSSLTAGVGGVQISSVDTSGSLDIKSGTTTIVSITSAGAAITGAVTGTSFGGALNGSLGATTPSTVVATTGTFSGVGRFNQAPINSTTISAATTAISVPSNSGIWFDGAISYNSYLGRVATDDALRYYTVIGTTPTERVSFSSSGLSVTGGLTTTGEINGATLFGQGISIGNGSSQTVTCPRSFDTRGAQIFIGGVVQGVGGRAGLYITTGYGNGVTTISAFAGLTVTCNTTAGTINIANASGATVDGRVTVTY
jgi:hypothetical protein